jgi:hypothetical protein
MSEKESRKVRSAPARDLREPLRRGTAVASLGSYVLSWRPPVPEQPEECSPNCTQAEWLQ